MHLFSGAGGGILADLLLGHQPVCAVEINEYCQQVLSARQKDGCLPWFPIFADVTQFDGRRWRGAVDVVSGGFPCTDISAAGKGAGINGKASGLWVEMARIICEVRPKLIVVENSPMLTTRGLGTVLGDLAGMGFDARWGVFRASSVGAAHHRARLYLVAYPNGSKLEGVDFSEPIEIDTAQSRRRQFARAIDAALPADDYTSMPRNPDDVARGMDGLKATGNGWVPKMAARAIRLLTHNI